MLVPATALIGILFCSNTLITPTGQKRAIVNLSPETPAADIATHLGTI